MNCYFICIDIFNPGNRRINAFVYFPVTDMASCKQLQTVQLLLQLLPEENVQLLQSLMQLLRRVAAEDANKMTADTLGTLFAPHILVPRKVSFQLCHFFGPTVTITLPI